MRLPGDKGGKGGGGVCTSCYLTINNKDNTKILIPIRSLETLSALLRLLNFVIHLIALS